MEADTVLTDTRTGRPVRLADTVCADTGRKHTLLGYSQGHILLADRDGVLRRERCAFVGLEVRQNT